MNDNEKKNSLLSHKNITKVAVNCFRMHRSTAISSDAIYVHYLSKNWKRDA